MSKNLILGLKIPKHICGKKYILMGINLNGKHDEITLTNNVAATSVNIICSYGF